MSGQKQGQVTVKTRSPQCVREMCAPSEQVPVARSAPESQRAAAVSDGRGGVGGVEWGAPGTTQGSGGFWVGAVFLPEESLSLCPRKLFPDIAQLCIHCKGVPSRPRRKEAEVAYTVAFTAHPPLLHLLCP